MRREHDWVWEHATRCRRERWQIWRSVKTASPKADGYYNTTNAPSFFAI
jgi:hypothetical protein